MDLCPLGFVSIFQSIWCNMNWFGLCLLFFYITFLIWWGLIVYWNFFSACVSFVFSLLLWLFLLCFRSRRCILSSIATMRGVSLVSPLCCVFHSVLDCHISRVSLTQSARWPAGFLGFLTEWWTFFLRTLIETMSGTAGQSHSFKSTSHPHLLICHVFGNEH